MYLLLLFLTRFFYPIHYLSHETDTNDAQEKRHDRRSASKSRRTL